MKINIDRPSPTAFLIPAEQAAKESNPEDAIIQCMAGLSAIIETLELDAYNNDDNLTMSHHTLCDLLWGLRGNVDTLKYLQQVQRLYVSDRLKQGRKTTHQHNTAR